VTSRIRLVDELTADGADVVVLAAAA